MSEEMLFYIEQVSALIKSNVEKREQLVGELVAKFCKSEYKRLVIIASGSSFNASNAAKQFIYDILKIEVKIVTPFQFTNYENRLYADDFILVISQSGKSSNILDAVEYCNNHNYPVYGLTSNVNSTLSKYTSALFDLGIGEETVEFVTKGYSLTILYLMLFALESSYKTRAIQEDEYTQLLNDILLCDNHIKTMISSTKEFYEANRVKIIRLRRIQIIGSGSNYATALEGALKLSEVLGFPATGYDLEEFLHGPYLEVDELVGVFIINTKHLENKRAHNIYDSIKVLSNQRYMVEIEEEANPLVSVLYLVSFFQVLTNLIMKDRQILDQSEASRVFEQLVKSKI